MALAVRSSDCSSDGEIPLDSKATSLRVDCGTQHMFIGSGQGGKGGGEDGGAKWM